MSLSEEQKRRVGISHIDNTTFAEVGQSFIAFNPPGMCDLALQQQEVVDRLPQVGGRVVEVDGIKGISVPKDNADSILDTVYKVMEPLTTGIQAASTIHAPEVQETSRQPMYMPQRIDVNPLTAEKTSTLGIYRVTADRGTTTISFESREAADAVVKSEGVGDIMKKYGARVSFGTSICVGKNADKLLNEIYEKIHPSEVKKDVDVVKAPLADAPALPASVMAAAQTISRDLSASGVESAQEQRGNTDREAPQQSARRGFLPNLGISSFVARLTGHNNAPGNGQGGGVPSR